MGYFTTTKKHDKYGRDGRSNGRMDRRMNQWTEKQTDGLVVSKYDGWTDGKTDKRTRALLLLVMHKRIKT